MSKITRLTTLGPYLLLISILLGAASGNPVPHEKAREQVLHGASASVTWSPDSRRLAALDLNDQSIRIWDLASGRQIRRVRSHQGSFASVCWTAQGLLAILTREHDALLWNATAGRRVSDLRSSHGQWVSWSTGGKRLATWGETGHPTSVWSFAGGEPLWSRWAEAAGLAWSPDGQRLALVSDAADVWLVDAATGQEVKALQRYPGWDFGHSPRPAAWSPDGTRLAAAVWRTPEPDDAVGVWDVGTGSVFVTIPEKENAEGEGILTAIAWGPDSGTLAYSREPGGVRVRELTSGRNQKLSPEAAFFLSLAWSPDGKYLAAGCVDGNVHVWEVDEPHDLSGGRAAPMACRPRHGGAGINASR